MSTATNKTKFTVSGKTMTMDRVYDAPRELVFKTWSEPEHLKQWWGPTDWTLPVCEVDFRPGGSWVYCMRGPDSMDNMEGWGRATYQEIVVPERIVYLDAFADDQGNALDNMPQSLITVEFFDVNGKTRVLSTTTFASEEDLQQTVAMGVEEGAKQTWDRLETHLASL